MKILLVDDSKTMRNIQHKALNSLGYSDIVEAEDGQQALDQVAAHSPGLILLDWNMPVMNGMEFLKTFRAQDAATPVIMVTTEAEKSRVIEAIKAGVSNYMVKPFTADILKARIDETLAKAA